MAFDPYDKSFPLGTSSAQLSLGLGANEALMITSALAVNTSVAARLVYVNLASDGAAAANSNAVVFGKSVAVGDSPGLAMTGTNVIPGAKVYAHADVSGVTLRISGLVTAQPPRTW